MVEKTGWWAGVIPSFAGIVLLIGAIASGYLSNKLDNLALQIDKTKYEQEKLDQKQHEVAEAESSIRQREEAVLTAQRIMDEKEAALTSTIHDLQLWQDDARCYVEADRILIFAQSEGYIYGPDLKYRLYTYLAERKHDEALDYVATLCNSEDTESVARIDYAAQLYRLLGDVHYRDLAIKLIFTGTKDEYHFWQYFSPISLGWTGDDAAELLAGYLEFFPIDPAAGQIMHRYSSDYWASQYRSFHICLRSSMDTIKGDGYNALQDSIIQILAQHLLDANRFAGQLITGHRDSDCNYYIDDSIYIEAASLYCDLSPSRFLFTASQVLANPDTYQALPDMTNALIQCIERLMRDSKLSERYRLNIIDKLDDPNSWVAWQDLSADD